MTGTERAIRWSTVAAVAVVAGIAGWAGYEHAYMVVSQHGETGLVARVYPGTIDGLIYAASMVLLDAARRRLPAPALARWLLAAGIAATLAANVAAGIRYGLLGAVVAAWPAPALVGSYELLMWLVRSNAMPVLQADAGQAGTVPEPPAALNGHGEAAAEIFRADLAEGRVPGVRRIRKELNVGQPKAQEVRTYLAGLANGSGGE